MNPSSKATFLAVLCNTGSLPFDLVTRAYLMSPPEHFVVEYAINPWMDTTTPVDTELAVKQWEGLRETFVRLGHEVHVLPPEIGLPDMVYAANGAFSVDGVVYGARYKYPQRMAEAVAHRRFYTQRGWEFVHPAETNEGEGGLTHLPAGLGGRIPGR